MSNAKLSYQHDVERPNNYATDLLSAHSDCSRRKRGLPTFPSHFALCSPNVVDLAARLSRLEQAQKK